MPRRPIGTTGLEASVLSLGSWHTYDRIDFHDGVELLRHAVAAGINLFDVGVYGGLPASPGGRPQYCYTDILFARMMEAAGVARDRYLISGKLWLEQWPQQSMAEQLDRALFRISEERFDFTILGDVRAPDTDFEKLVGELGALVASGKLGAWGVNNWSAQDLRTVHEIAQAQSLPGPQMAQLKYSLCRRAIPEGEPYAKLFRETGISLEASDVFEGGLLAGRHSSDRGIGQDPGQVRQSMNAVLPKIQQLATRFDTTPAKLAIAFCLDHSSLTSVLFGASRLSQLEDNLGALELYAQHGDEIRAETGDLWLDRGVVDPNGP